MKYQRLIEISFALSCAAGWAFFKSMGPAWILVPAIPALFMSMRGASLILSELVKTPPLLARPPRNARFLILLLMRGAAGDALLGDLEERFPRMVGEFGLGRARFWYWFQVFVSLRPLAWAFVKRVTGLAAAYEAILKVLK